MESYTGQVEIGKCTEQKYLDFLLSSSGDYMVNIRSVRNKSIGTIRKIFEQAGAELCQVQFQLSLLKLFPMRLSSLKLKYSYYFLC